MQNKKISQVAFPCTSKLGEATVLLFGFLKLTEVTLWMPQHVIVFFPCIMTDDLGKSEHQQPHTKWWILIIRCASSAKCSVRRVRFCLKFLKTSESSQECDLSVELISECFIYAWCANPLCMFLTLPAETFTLLTDSWRDLHNSSTARVKLWRQKELILVTWRYKS